MNFLRSYENGSHKHVKSYFENLISIAMADGKMDDSEYAFLLRVGEKLFTTEDEIKNILDHPKHYVFHAPASKDARLELLKDLVAMLLVDGKILEEEIKMCRKFAIVLHYKPEIVVQIVNCLVKYASTEFDKYDVLAEIEEIAE
ncbi:MAG: TerB family tellurite resistance protein [Bacteroidetes bacterium]|jgi:uncharacterized tellurite resistance protein B-like protein|nr:TerB family tellurite resistance protein [Bacteroidota bacterium]MBT5531008.1 TerB family tellurite resistance protein [Cytophagia bacterium]MBT3423803.1 TerB family tellurite resistance protein [Bacteroidota bacterium]MBT5990486.1 TerB family tellurite resistance protein [Bacteroidota bacterium]MBT6834559.1 TerB family tellurite resistance protein [Bacteroidota bacterium]